MERPSGAGAKLIPNLFPKTIKFGSFMNCGRPVVDIVNEVGYRDEMNLSFEWPDDRYFFIMVSMLLACHFTLYIMEKIGKQGDMKM